MPRGLLKTMTYSLMHLTVAMAVAYALTGNWAVAFSIGLIEPLVQTIAYTVHERLWEKWIPGGDKPVESVHACSHTLIRIREDAPNRARPDDAGQPLPSPA
mgnify:CR=1 FL=1